MNTMGEKITIVTVCDNHYIVMLAALIKSIEENHHTGEGIDFYIVGDHLSRDRIQKLEQSVKPGLITLHWLKMSEVIPTDVSLPLDRSSFPLSIYVRLFVPHFIPANIEKVLYLDADIIVLEDISKLWRIDLNNNIIAGVLDKSEIIGNPWAGISNYKDLGLSADTKYFNSGVLLIDCFKWRAAGATNSILTCIKNNINFLDFPDQYGLNVIFAGKWLELDGLWNTQSVSEIERPYLIHFTGKKPIYKSYTGNVRYKEIFYDYLRLTVWKHYTPIGEYRRLLKRLYNIFEKRVWFVKKKYKISG